MAARPGPTRRPGAGRRADPRVRRRHRGRLAGRRRRLDPARAGPRGRGSALGRHHADPLRRDRRAHRPEPRLPAGRIASPGPVPPGRDGRRRPCRRGQYRPPLPRAAGPARESGDPAGHRRVHRHAQNRGAVPRRGTGQPARPQRPARGDSRRRRLLVAAALPRHGAVLPARVRAGRNVVVARAHLGFHRLAVSLARVVVGEPGHHHRGAELRLQPGRQIRPPGLRRRPGRPAGGDQRRGAGRLRRLRALRNRHGPVRFRRRCRHPVLRPGGGDVCGQRAGARHRAAVRRRQRRDRDAPARGAGRADPRHRDPDLAAPRRTGRRRRDRDPGRVDDGRLPGSRADRPPKLVSHRRSRLLLRRRAGGVRPGQGADHPGRPQHLPDRDRDGRRPGARRAGRRRGGAGHRREFRAPRPDHRRRIRWPRSGRRARRGDPAGRVGVRRRSLRCDLHGTGVAAPKPRRANYAAWTCGAHWRRWTK